MVIDNEILHIQQVLQKQIAQEELRYLSQSDIDYPWTKMNYDSKKINTISLFSGCGGLDLGVELAGIAAVVGEKAAKEAFHSKMAFNELRKKSIFHMVYTNDLFNEANETYAQNFEHTIQHGIDIRKVRYFPKADLIIGGFPCTGFSIGGVRLIQNERNFLYLHFIRAITQAKPAVFIAENVKGMLTLGKGEVIRQITDDFSAAGYQVQYQLLNARDYGVPQLRERVFIVGVRNDISYDYQYPQATHGEKLQPFVTLQDAIGDLKDYPGPYYTGSYSSMYMSRNRKKRWNEQSFTIQASGRQAPLHPGGLPMEHVGKDQWQFPDGETFHRRLSVKEIARIQTFPDWFTFSDGGNLDASENSRVDKQYKQIGNAVPVMLAKAVATPIAQWAVTYLQRREQQNSQQLMLF